MLYLILYEIGSVSLMVCEKYLYPLSNFNCKVVIVKFGMISHLPLSSHVGSKMENDRDFCFPIVNFSFGVIFSKALMGGCGFCLMNE